MASFEDNSLSIGNTPLIKLNRIVNGPGTKVYGKIEGRNPTYSVKCRIGASMIWDAEQRGLLKPRRGTGGAHQRQYGDRSGVRCGVARLLDYIDHARNHVTGAAQGAEGIRRPPGAHRGRERNARSHRQGGRDL